MIRFLIKQLVKISPFEFLIASVAEIGWSVSVEVCENVEGLVIGTEEYIDRHIPEEV